jgi:hypothetical protein
MVGFALFVFATGQSRVKFKNQVGQQRIASGVSARNSEQCCPRGDSAVLKLL